MANMGDSGKFGPAMRNVPNSLAKKPKWKPTANGNVKAKAQLTARKAPGAMVDRYIGFKEKNNYTQGKLKNAAKRMFGL